MIIRAAKLLHGEREMKTRDPVATLSSSDGTSSLLIETSAYGREGEQGTRRTLRQSCLTTSRLAENAAARSAEDDGLRVREDGRDREAACKIGQAESQRITIVQTWLPYAPGHLTSMK